MSKTRLWVYGGVLASLMLPAPALLAAEPASDDVRAVLNQAKEDLTTAVQTIRRQQGEIGGLRQELQRLRAGTDQALREQVSQLTRQLADKEAALAQLKATGTPLPSDARVPLLSEQVETLQSELDRMTRRYQAALQQAKANPTPTAAVAKPTAVGPEIAQLKQDVARLQLSLKTTQAAHQQALQALKQAQASKAQPSSAKSTELARLTAERDNAREALSIALSELRASKTRTASASPSPARLSADAEAERQRLTATIQQLRQALRRNPLAQAQAEEAAGQPQAARKTLEAARDLTPDDGATRRALASLLIRQGEPQAALQELNDYLKRCPDDLAAQWTRGRLALQQGDVAQGEASLAAAIPVDGLTQYAVVLKKQGRLSEAEAALRLATLLAPEQLDAHFALGTLFLASQRPQEARGQFEAALRVQPTHADSHYNLAATLLQLGEPAAARPHLNRYLSLSPKGPQAEPVRQLLKQLPASTAQR